MLGLCFCEWQGTGKDRHHHQQLFLNDMPLNVFHLLLTDSLGSYFMALSWWLVGRSIGRPFHYQLWITAREEEWKLWFFPSHSVILFLLYFLGKPTNGQTSSDDHPFSFCGIRRLIQPLWQLDETSSHFQMSDELINQSTLICGLSNTLRQLFKFRSKNVTFLLG